MLRTMFILFIAAALAACGSQPAAEWEAPLQQPFVLTADCSGSYTGSIRFSYDTAQSWCLDYLSPHAAAGLSIKQEAGQLILAQGTLKNCLNTDVLPQQSIFRTLCGAVTMCACVVPQQSDDGALVYQNADLEVRVQNGIVQTITDLSDGTQFHITGFQLQNAPSD